MSKDLQLPKNIDRYLATLSKLYATEGERQLQEILVNAQVRVDEGYHYDNWNGGTYGPGIGHRAVNTGPVFSPPRSSREFTGGPGRFVLAGRPGRFRRANSSVADCVKDTLPFFKFLF